MHLLGVILRAFMNADGDGDRVHIGEVSRRHARGVPGFIKDLDWRESERRTLRCSKPRIDGLRAVESAEPGAFSIAGWRRETRTILAT